ncbi:hypothetical protein [Achromobacter anxifer]|uniref:hypothetical protein n=1 Tax=Achromobacter anxifer TaxID=1287737 RepID=UPI0023F68CDB|nr:hypothetical protein [Achromobacter anxifer]MDF8364737.1 hypothetical protein [Achromobacter anxifer]
MHMYVIVAVRKNSITHHVERVLWGEAAPGQGGWKSPPVEACATDVIGAIERGVQVETALSVDGTEIARRALALSDLPEF